MLLTWISPVSYYFLKTYGHERVWNDLCVSYDISIRQNYSGRPDLQLEAFPHKCMIAVHFLWVFLNIKVSSTLRDFPVLSLCIGQIKNTFLLPKSVGKSFYQDLELIMLTKSSNAKKSNSSSVNVSHINSIPRFWFAHHITTKECHEK